MPECSTLRVGNGGRNKSASSGELEAHVEEVAVFVDADRGETDFYGV
jgi:hypothetical protein